MGCQEQSKLDTQASNTEAQFQLNLLYFDEESHTSQLEFMGYLRLALRNRNSKAIDFLEDYPHLIKYFLPELTDYLSNSSGLNRAAFLVAFHKLSLEVTSQSECLEQINQLNRLAKENHLPSLLLLSKLYADGKVVSLSNFKSLGYLIKSARQDTESAKKILHFFNGKKPNKRAFSLAENLACKGYDPALFYLAFHTQSPHYFEKINTEMGYLKAIPFNTQGLLTEEEEEQLTWKIYNYYFSKSEKNDPKALVYIGNHYLYGQLIPASVQLAAECFQKAAAQDNGKALYLLGCLVWGGHGVSRSKENALLLFEKAAALNDVDALWYLGFFYEEEGDLTNSFLYFKKAADSGDAAAQYLVGRRYEYGHGVDKSPYNAFKYYQEAVNRDLKSSSMQISVHHKLAHCFLKGMGTTQSNEKAAHYFKQGAKNFGSWQSTWNTGVCFLKDKKIHQSISKAEDYFCLAIQRMEATRLLKVDPFDSDRTFNEAQKYYFEKWVDYQSNHRIAVLDCFVDEEISLEGSIEEELHKMKYLIAKSSATGYFRLGWFYLQNLNEFNYIDPEFYFITPDVPEGYFFRGLYKSNSKFKQKYLEQAAEEGIPKAYYELGKMHLENDSEKAIEYLKYGASLGDTDCMIALAEFFIKEPETSHQWYLEAANQDHPKGFLGLSVHAFQSGNMTEAIHYFDLFLKICYSPATIEWICNLIESVLPAQAKRYREIFIKPFKRLKDYLEDLEKLKRSSS